MKVTKTIGSYTFTVENASVKKVWEDLASINEVFGDEKCGCCGSKNITPSFRVVEKNKKSYDYYEMKCLETKCRARLSYGQHQEGGGIFPHRKLGEDGRADRVNGQYGPHNGWSRFKGAAAEASEPEPEPVSSSRSGSNFRSNASTSF